MFRSEEEAQYYLLTIQDGRTALMLAARGGHTLTVKALIVVCVFAYMCVCIFLCVYVYLCA